jgi:hypothetical protein
MVVACSYCEEIYKLYLWAGAIACLSGYIYYCSHRLRETNTLKRRRGQGKEDKEDKEDKGDKGAGEQGSGGALGLWGGGGAENNQCPMPTNH